ncbi:hypothetical protein HCG49_16950 [Arenibacter sp. 6A1]|uniref:hypothetical protein n=1 Tax=Arenibacter sp. 6A1 TaxID=2720391 RepID=UPI0014451B10|nr:hypothetical protein [Arenibacter sp. 6A1]NKI28244.1 hypothetical protein [Arenibacter sp. 6A1]
MEEIKKHTEGEVKDIILKHALEKSNKTISAREIKIIFPGITFEEIQFLLEKMQNTVDKVADVRISKTNCFLIANEITNQFLTQGGFSKIEKDAAEQEKKRAHKEHLELEGSITSLRLNKCKLKTFPWFFSFALIGAGLSVYNFIQSLRPTKTAIQHSERLEKMQAEIETLHTYISLQKNQDSLQSTKVLYENTYTPTLKSKGE